MSQTKFRSLQRTLCILRHLQRDPADKTTLASFVEIECEPDVYNGFQTNADNKRFEHDMKRLREWGADYEYIAENKAYRLITLGDFNPLCLSENELDTVAFLSETFAPGAPKSEQVQELLQHVLATLIDRQRSAVQGRRRRLQVDLRRRDSGEILVKVQNAIDRAITQRRLLRFGYLSPMQADGIPRTHTVQPWNYLFDAARGHYYLDGYRLQVDGPHGVWKKGSWQPYRPERILPEDIKVLPDKLPPTPPKRPRYEIEYMLAPEVARLGQISRHFEDMQIHETNADGWTRVTGVTTDLFFAVRQLLGYGANCKVIGGPEAKREMKSIVEKMAMVYQ